MTINGVEWLWVRPGWRFDEAGPVVVFIRQSNEWGKIRRRLLGAEIVIECG